MPSTNEEYERNIFKRKNVGMKHQGQINYRQPKAKTDIPSYQFIFKVVSSFCCFQICLITEN
jgi:hypothetical protein